MKEIGGYFELETFTGEPYHPGLIKLNLGRTALLYMLQQMKAHTLYVPHFLCGSVLDTCKENGVTLLYYPIDRRLHPVFTGKMKPGECFYLVNLYGLLDEKTILSVAEQVGTLIVDHTHAFFQKAIPGIPALYSIRKFFGLSDGAYVDMGSGSRSESEGAASLEAVPFDSSCGRYGHILGRYEKSASIFYQQMLDNAHTYDHAPLMRMSPLTQNLLQGIDYERTRVRREENYQTLAFLLGSRNPLPLPAEGPIGPFAYPFYCPDGLRIRKAMAKESIFIPTYWNNVLQEMPTDSLEYDYAANILPLPCDQRYQKEDMERVADVLIGLLEE
ncbi:MAG: hypothetical protein IJI24_01790 [Lachnospiraceae bacterium]|nr:hypothetical protein [Lachnospiraceae bacterium]